MDGRTREITALPKAFYNRSPKCVAQELLGKILQHDTDGVRCSGRIVETEAYLAHGDPANHAACGRTARNNAMFGPPGRAYVYFCYGNHWLINAVTEPEGTPSAVLIRALEPLEETAVMQQRRRVKREVDLTNGPAKLCAALAITGRLNETELYCGNLLILDDGAHPPPRRASGRVGIRVGTDRQARFYVPGNRFVSGGG